MNAQRFTLGLTLLTIGLSGCASWSKPSTSEKSWNPTTWFKKEYQDPTSMATIWKAERMAEEPGQPEKRGFNATVYFYNDRSQAIPVEGELTVHGYVTTPSSRKVTNEQPDQKFVFSAEQIAKQYAPSEMGACYGIWVPWDVDGYREEITLIATFKSKKGSVVQGSPTRLLLPGKPRYPEEVSQTGSPNGKAIPAKTVGFTRTESPKYDLPASPELPSSTRVTTLKLPENSKLVRPDARNNRPSTSVSTEMLDGSAVEVGGQRSNVGSPTGYNLQTLPPPPVR